MKGLRVSERTIQASRMMSMRLSNCTLQANRMKGMRIESPHLDSMRLLISFIATTHTRFPPTPIDGSALKKSVMTKGGSLLELHGGATYLMIEN